MITRAKVIFGIICGVLGGLVFFIEALHNFPVRNAPIVSGQIIARTPTSFYSVPRVDFTIQIDGTTTEVHARAARGLMAKVPTDVRFHYSGDPAREVFLLEHEGNPWLLVLLFWGMSLLLALPFVSSNVRSMLGWKERRS
jgi:hypothetical protein